MALSVHASQLEALFVNKGYPVMLEGYSKELEYFPQFAETVVGKPDALNARFPEFLYGHIFSEVLGMERPKVIEHGQEIPASTIAGGYAPQAKTRKLARRIDITREDLKVRHAMDAIGDKMQMFAAGMGASHKIMRDVLVADYLQKGTIDAGRPDVFLNRYKGRTTGITDGKIYDGQAFFDTAHPQDDGASVTYSNINASLELTGENLSSVRQIMSGTNNRDGRGEIFPMAPNTLIVPSILEDRAKGLISAEFLPGTANNDRNPNAGRFGVIVNPYLTDDAATIAGAQWILAERNKGLLVVHTGDPEVEVVEDPLTGTVSILAVSYVLVMVTNWRHWYSANKATS